MATTNTWVGAGDVRVTGSGLQEAPASAALVGGGTVIVWLDTTGVGQVHAQRLDAAGNKVGAEMALTTSPAGGVPGVVGTNDGGFVITWDSRVDAAAPTNYLGQHFDVNGNPLSAPFPANALPNFDPAASAEVTALAGGGFVMQWWQDPGGPTHFGPSMQVYNAAGAPVGGNVQLAYEADGTPFGPGTLIHSASTAATPDGGFVVVWATSEAFQPAAGTTDHIYVQRFNANGNALAGPVEAITDPTTVLDVASVEATAVTGTADIVIAARGTLPDGRSEITAQRFSTAGAPITGVQTMISASSMVDSKVTALSDGSLVVSWLDSQVTLDLKQQQSVFAQRLDAGLVKLGDPILVAASQAGSTTEYSVSATPDGGAVFAWNDSRTDGGDVFTQKFATGVDTSPPFVSRFPRTPGPGMSA